jgi:hypothetical protein
LAFTRFDEALREADAVDRFLSSTSKTKGELEDTKPLLGVPVTVKESLAVAGMIEGQRTSICVHSWIVTVYTDVYPFLSMYNFFDFFFKVSLYIVTSYFCIHDQYQKTLLVGLSHFLFNFITFSNYVVHSLD